MCRTSRSAVALLVFCSAELVAGCAARPAHTANAPTSVRLDAEFSLSHGRLAVVGGEPLTVKFASVASDSRCPMDAQCVWAGNAEVQIEADMNGTRSTLKVNTHGGPQYPKHAQWQTYTVELVALLPVPRLNRQIQPSETSVRLVIRKGPG